MQSNRTRNGLGRLVLVLNFPCRIRGGSELFLDFLHPSALGSEIAAQALLEYFEGEQLLSAME